MSDWVTKAESILTTLGIPYGLMRYVDINTTQLPDTYIVYFLVDDRGKEWADGEEISRSPRIQVSLFFREKPIYSTVPSQIEAAFIQGGFLRVGSGNIPYSEITGHYGWRCDFRNYEGS